MPPQQIYLLRIMEGPRCVAEAPLIVHDKEAALRNFYEALPQAIQVMAGGIVGMVQRACSDQEPAAPQVGILMVGNHSGLQLVTELPKNGKPPGG